MIDLIFFNDIAKAKTYLSQLVSSYIQLIIGLNNYKFKDTSNDKQFDSLSIEFLRIIINQKNDLSNIEIITPPSISSGFSTRKKLFDLVAIDENYDLDERNKQKLQDVITDIREFLIISNGLLSQYEHHLLIENLNLKKFIYPILQGYAKQFEKIFDNSVITDDDKILRQNDLDNLHTFLSSEIFKEDFFSNLKLNVNEISFSDYFNQFIIIENMNYLPGEKFKLSVYEEKISHIIQQYTVLNSEKSTSLLGVEFYKQFKLSSGEKLTWDSLLASKISRWLFALVTLFIISLGYLVYLLFFMNDKASDNVLIIYRLGLLLTMVFPIWFCASQYNKEKRIIEHYAHKKTIAMMTTAFKEEMEGESQDIKKTAYDKLFSELLRFPLDDNQSENQQLTELVKILVNQYGVSEKTIKDILLKQIEQEKK